MTDKRSNIIDCTAPLREALRLLDQNVPKILFLTKELKLIGTLTDGDVRRFLLRGGVMSAPSLDAANKSPKAAKNKAEAIDMLVTLGHVAIPIVDKENNIVDILYKDSRYKDEKKQINLPVVIMAGGMGTRLDPFTRVLPKPLIPIGDIPIIQHIMNQFAEYGCDDFHIIVNYKKELIKAYFSDINVPYHISWHDEKMALGTGGGLGLLKECIDSTFILSNCDILVSADYADILHYHRKNRNLVTMICAYRNIKIPYGVIETGANGRIINMREKPEMSFQTNTGVYLVEPSVLETIEDDTPIGFPDIMKRLVDKRIAAYPISEHDWLDMGQFDEMERMLERLYGK